MRVSFTKPPAGWSAGARKDGYLPELNFVSSARRSARVKETRSTFPTRFVWTAIALFGAMIVGMSGARTQPQRVLYGAAQMGFALMCLGRAAWLYAEEIARRREFVWLFRHYSGRQAIRFTYAMKAGGVAFGLMGLWSFAIWVMALWAG